MPETIQTLKRRERAAALSRFARQSAKASSVKSKLYLKIFEKDKQGAPRPSNGIYWSVSHKPDVVAGVVSKEKIGIDVEVIKDVSDALFNRIVDPDERANFGSQEKRSVFFRAFTSKEAVLKKTTDGFSNLSKVKIDSVIDGNNLLVAYKDNKYLIENFYFDGYLASVTKDHFDVQWTIR